MHGFFSKIVQILAGVQAPEAQSQSPPPRGRRSGRVCNFNSQNNCDRAQLRRSKGEMPRTVSGALDTIPVEILGGGSFRSAGDLGFRFEPVL